MVDKHKPLEETAKDESIPSTPSWNKMRAEPIKIEEPIKEEKPESEKAKILREHGGLESNIPINSPYWQMPW